MTHSTDKPENKKIRLSSKQIYVLEKLALETGLFIKNTPHGIEINDRRLNYIGRMSRPTFNVLVRYDILTQSQHNKWVLNPKIKYVECLTKHIHPENLPIVSSLTWWNNS